MREQTCSKFSNLLKISRCSGRSDGLWKLQSEGQHIPRKKRKGGVKGERLGQQRKGKSSDRGRDWKRIPKSVWVTALEKRSVAWLGCVVLAELCIQPHSQGVICALLPVGLLQGLSKLLHGFQEFQSAKLNDHSWKLYLQILVGNNLPVKPIRFKCDKWLKHYCGNY